LIFSFRIVARVSILCFKIREFRILATIKIVIFLLESYLLILERVAIILATRLILKQLVIIASFICFIAIEANYN